MLAQWMKRFASSMCIAPPHEDAENKHRNGAASATVVFTNLATVHTQLENDLERCCSGHNAQCLLRVQMEILWIARQCGRGGYGVFEGVEKDPNNVASVAFHIFRKLQENDGRLAQYTSMTSIATVACVCVAEKLCGPDYSDFSPFYIISRVFMRRGTDASFLHIRLLVKTERKILREVRLLRILQNNIRTRAMLLLTNSDLFAFWTKSRVEKATMLTFYVTWAIGVHTIVEENSAYESAKAICYVCLAMVEVTEMSCITRVSRMNPLTRALSYRVTLALSTKSPLEMQSQVGGTFNAQGTWENVATSAFTICRVLQAMA